jgi:hypothetical protein
MIDRLNAWVREKGATSRDMYAWGVEDERKRILGIIDQHLELNYHFSNTMMGLHLKEDMRRYGALREQLQILREWVQPKRRCDNTHCTASA